MRSNEHNFESKPLTIVCGRADFIGNRYTQHLHIIDRCCQAIATCPRQVSPKVQDRARQTNRVSGTICCQWQPSSGLPTCKSHLDQRRSPPLQPRDQVLQLGHSPMLRCPAGCMAKSENTFVCHQRHNLHFPTNQEVFSTASMQFKDHV